MLKKILTSELGKGALVLFITINLFNFLNFLFHFSMGRMLGPEDYGILAVLMSLVYFYAIPTEAIQNIISRYTSQFNIKKEYGKIKFLLLKSLNKTFKISIILFLFLVLIGIFLSFFLQINFWLIFITNIFIFFSVSMPITRGVLQGRKKFSSLGINMVIEALLKLVFAISLVIFGFKVFGAITGAILGCLFALVFSLYFNKDILKTKEQKTSFEGIYLQSAPYFITIFVIFISLSLDIILAKRFFSPELAGQYAALSMLGKIIFLGTISISKTMFPLTSEKHDCNKDSSKLFKKSMLIIVLLCSFAVLIYALFPKLIIMILYGSQYIAMAPFLIYSALALSFLALTNIVLMYNLSINKLRKYYYLFLFPVIQVILLVLFHNTILEYIFALMVSNIVMFIGSLILVKKS